MGFCGQWVDWTMMCVSSVNYSVLMNFDRVSPITPGRGLRQGDPLSPYLFILVTEGLTSPLVEVTYMGCASVEVPLRCHLLFADDCFLFCRANVTEVNQLLRILHTYEQASGQEINLSKSEVFISRNISHVDKEDLSGILGVRHVLCTGTYLGLPSMIGRSKKNTFSYIKDRIWKRINSWRGRALSKAGKEVMIKSVLQAIPSYVMSMFILPSSFIGDIEKMLNAFWWGGGGNNGRGIHWLAWEKLACPKTKGGLGFRNFKAFNLAMVAKQAWNIVQNPDSLVAKVIKARWSIGGGDKINIMKNPWLRGSNERWVPSPQEEGPMTNLIINTPLIASVHEDKIVWNEERNGCYSVKSGYSLAMRHIL
ncbi:ribonuclease H, partial [Trifolium pratense]